MYIQKIHIHDFRGLEDIALDFKPGVNILLGDNGTGKTTILEAVTVALGGYLLGIQNLKVGGLQQDDFRTGSLKLGGASNAIQYYAPEIGFEFVVDGQIMSGFRTRSDRSGSGRTTTRCAELQRYAQYIANDASSRMPLLSYMSISRVTMARRSDYGKAVKNQLNDRRCGYVGCMASVIDKQSILEWVKKMSYQAVLNNRSMPELDFFRNTVASIMAKVNGMEEKPEIRYSAEFDGIAYVENGEMKPVTVLSSGYQSVLWMAMDFAFRLALLNPEMTDSAQAQGIVLIDEIDMHLHPKWQWTVLDALRDTFPNVQFIVATHAPIIISSCDKANLICLKESGEVEYLDSAYGYSVNNVLELRQHSKGLLPAMRKAVDQFDMCLNAGDLKGAEAILSEMEENFGRENAEVVEARTEYELESMMAEE